MAGENGGNNFRGEGEEKWWWRWWLLISEGLAMMGLDTGGNEEEVEEVEEEW